jgi:uncharacterized protein YdeI (YjbR/CyaY-like superfamily)
MAASKFFKTPAALRAWFSKNHAGSQELSVGFYKKSSGKPSVTYHEAVDQALCFGWIDGVRNGIDESSYRIRFTPRKAKSIWSNVNKTCYAALLAEGQITEAGAAAFARHDAKRAASYSFENKDEPLAAGHAKTFRANKAAWEFFHAQAPSYQRACRWWIKSASSPRPPCGGSRS